MMKFTIHSPLKYDICHTILNLVKTILLCWIDPDDVSRSMLNVADLPANTIRYDCKEEKR